MHVFITETLWTHLGKAVTKVCGQGSLSKCNGCWSYIAEQRNPLLQILYLFFITGSISIFMSCGYDLLDATTLSPVHKQFIIPFVIAFTYACFFLASAIGPGEINAQNVKHALEVYPYDHLLFDPKICGTCKIQNAVQVCWYGTYLIYRIFISRMFDSPMYKFLVATKRWEMLGPFKNYHIFLYQMQSDRSLGGLGVFAGLAGLVVFIFFLYNLYLVATGVTTNESFKWEDIGEMIHRRELVEVTKVDASGASVGPKVYEQRDRRHPSHPRHVAPHPQQQQQQHQQQNQQVPQPYSQVQQHAQPTSQVPQFVSQKEYVITKLKEIDNIYDQGVKANIKSILFPPSLDTSSSPFAADRGNQRSLYERVQKSKKGA
ncbi:hypothetical protein EDD11_006520 [Mortierella claussenii]|nr:hypothetical protein EDD11_006520 [Mortierella claussenii]